MKHFSVKRDNNYFIHTAAVLSTENDPIKEINIKRICFEKHLYTLPGTTVEERMWLERIYSDVFEKDYDKLYEMLTDKKKTRITQAEREFAISTVIAMYYRTTNWNRFAYRVMDDIIERGYYMAKQSPHDHFMMEDRKISIANKTVEQLKKEHRKETKTLIALNQLRNIIKLTSIRSVADGLMITKLTSDTDEFITSDNPVECHNINQGYIVPINPSNTFSLPLDPKHHLTSIPNDHPEWRFIIRRKEYDHSSSLLPMLGLNRGQEQNAQKFILGSRNGLTNYFNSKNEIESTEPNERVIKARKLIEIFGKL
jgi:hypothetical protein